MAGLGVTQIQPLDANAGFSQNVSVSLGSGGSYSPSGFAPTAAGQPAGTESTEPNWTVIAAIVAVAGYLIFRK